jgi:hypothetical protein
LDVFAALLEATSEGREISTTMAFVRMVFGYCTACHNTALIRRSAFTRDRWDELMDWMAEKHGMNPLEGEFRTIIVDYLGRHYGPRARSPRGGNPFRN